LGIVMSFNKMFTRCLQEAFSNDTGTL